MISKGPNMEDKPRSDSELIVYHHDELIDGKEFGVICNSSEILSFRLKLMITLWTEGL